MSGRRVLLQFRLRCDNVPSVSNMTASTRSGSLVVRSFFGFSRINPDICQNFFTSVSNLFLLVLADLPRVLNMPVRLFLPRNMEGHIKCPVEANPPFTLIVWTKNERAIDFTHTSRLKLNKDGTLVIHEVDANDEGRYTCTPYSPLGSGRSSSPVQIHVRGKGAFVFLFFTQNIVSTIL